MTLLISASLVVASLILAVQLSMCSSWPEGELKAIQT